MGAAQRIVVVFSTVCIALLLGLASPASAQTNIERVYVGVAPPAIAQVVTAPGQTPAVVNPAPAPALPFQVSESAVTPTAQAPAGRLALTGVDVITLVLVGFGAVAVGIVLSRRPRQSSTAHS